jgi:hypothetical protein
MLDSRFKYAAAAVLALGLAAPEATGGQGPSVSKTENFRSDVVGEKTNPCPVVPETFAYQGKNHTQVQSGANHTRFTVHEQGVGFTPNGVRYQTQSWSENSEQGTTPALFTKFTIREHLIRTDPALANARDDFFVTTTLKCKAGDCRPEPPPEPRDPCR